MKQWVSIFFSLPLAAKILHRSPSCCPSEFLIKFNSRWAFGFLTPSPHALAMFLFSYWVAHACFHCLLSVFELSQEQPLHPCWHSAIFAQFPVYHKGQIPVLWGSCSWRLSSGLLRPAGLSQLLPLSDLTDLVPWNSPHRPCFLDSWTYTSYLLDPLQFLHISQNNKDEGGPKHDITFQMPDRQYQAYRKTPSPDVLLRWFDMCFTLHPLEKHY